MSCTGRFRGPGLAALTHTLILAVVASACASGSDGAATTNQTPTLVATQAPLVTTPPIPTPSPPTVAPTAAPSATAAPTATIEPTATPAPTATTVPTATTTAAEEPTTPVEPTAQPTTATALPTEPTTAATVVPETTAAPTTATQPPAGSADGAAIYAASCARCHGASGQGGRGPTLVGTGTLSAGNPGPIIARVTSGGTDMPAFGSQLSAEQINAVVNHVIATY